jgi:RIO kinase 1
MRVPSSLTSLVEEGVIDEVVGPLMSGKEAEVFLVRAGGELRVAKVYKEAQNRTFKNRAEYTEGRKVRNTRDQRAIQKGSRHGRSQDEAAWRSTEVDMIYRLRGAGVRVPVPHHFIDGVLVMEMVADAEGRPAPRLAEVSLDRDQAIRVFEGLLGETVRMLCTGVVHGDLSDFNVLMSAEGPVIIDFPQSVDAASNQNARKLLLRDVENLKRFLSRSAPEERPGAYAEEMWDLYAKSLLTPETRLTGRHRPSERRVDTAAVLDLVGEANHDERKRRERQGLSMRGVAQAAAPRAANGARPSPTRHPVQRPSSSPPSEGSAHRNGPSVRDRASSPAPPRSQPTAGHRPQQQGMRPQANAQRRHSAPHRPSQPPLQVSEEPQEAPRRRVVIIPGDTLQRGRGSRRNP